MAKSKEISDFGEKIGGARKDLAQLHKLGGFDVEDIGEWSDVERASHIVKKEVFVKPDYKALYDTGEYSREALYFQQRMYKALPTAPYLYPFVRDAVNEGRTEADGIHAGQEAYIRLMNKCRELLSNVKTNQDIFECSREIHNLLTDSTLDYKATKKMHSNLVTSQYALSSMSIKMDNEKFLYTDDEKKLSNATISQYDGTNFYNEYYIRAEIKGTVPLKEYLLTADETKELRETGFDGQAGDKVKAHPMHYTGVLKNCEYSIEGDNLVIAGTYIKRQAAKSLDELEAAATRDITEETNREHYNPLGKLQDITVKSVAIEDERQTRFVHKSGRHLRYYYDQKDNPCADVSKYEEGKYVVIVNNSKADGNPIAFNVDTVEEAKKIAIDYADIRDAALKAVRKATKEGKTKLLPPQLRHVQRVGEDYLDGGDVEVKQKVDAEGKPVTKTDENGKEIPVMECPAFETELGFRAGEFGNWENQEDRRNSLNMAYESFRDMANALGIAKKDASLGEDLAIAFGSRGRGGFAVAHYESAANVINITKMRGAGSLGHEWGHALDYAIARAEGRTITSKDTWCESHFAHNKDSLLHDVMETMKRTPEGGRTEFWKDAIYIDSVNSKTDKGYWQSDVELFARAFHTYLLDKMKLQGVRNDYLCGHAEYAPVKDDNGNLHYTYPRGEERERINAEFDKLIEVLKERGILHEQDIDKEHKLIHSQDGVTQDETLEQVKEVANRQLEFDIAESESSPSPTPEVPKVYQVFTNAGFDGGIDEKLEYATIEEATKAGEAYLNDGYLGFAVLNNDTKKIERVEGEFSVQQAFNDEVLRINGIEPEKAQEKAVEQLQDAVHMDEPEPLPEKEHKAQEGEKTMAEQKRGWGEPQAASEPPQKKSFQTTPSLNRLEETMSEHEPYAVMAMSTSGLGESAEPIHVVVQEYVFDDELKKYVKGLGFDRQVECSQEQLDSMLTSADYDYFGNAGIDKDAYVKGEGVLSKEEFANEFVPFMKTLEQGGEELLIINGGAEFAQKQLAKISPEAQQLIIDKQIDKSAISQTALTNDYFNRHGISSKDQKRTLENLRSMITPSPSGSFRKKLMEDSSLMNDYQTMSKEEFCKAAKVTPHQYDATKRDFELHEDKIIGANGRVNEIAHFAEADGREKGILENEYMSYLREADTYSRREMSEKGKVKYQNSDYEQKFELLIKQGVINPEAVLDRNSDCELNKFLNVMNKSGTDGEGHNKGFVVIQVATTGFDKHGGVGKPIQVSACAFDIGDDGTVTPVGSIAEYNIKADEKAVNDAVMTKNRGGFDAFGYTGIDVNEYLSGVGVHSEEETLKVLSEFFKKFPPEDYPIISNGSGKNDHSLTFSQEALLPMGNVKAFSDSKNCVDFAQASKEYSYVAYQEGMENVLTNNSAVKNFGLDGIVAANPEVTEALKQTQTEGKGILSSTLQRVNATTLLADAVRMQDMERNSPELYASIVQEVNDISQAETEPQSSPTSHEAEYTLDIASDDSVPVISPYDEDNEVFEKGDTAPEQDFSDSVDISDILDEPSETVNASIEDTRGHGNLYSDKKGDTRDVVIVEGDVKKVAQVEIPHVSEAVKESVGEHERPKEESGKRMASKQREHRRRTVPVKTEASTPELSPISDSQSVPELIAIIKSQQEMMNSMQNEMKSMREELSTERALNRSKENTISLFSEKLTHALAMQTELMAQIAGTPLQEVSKDYKSMTPTERVEAIENIKDEIVKLKETVPTGGRESAALSNANLQLSKVQNEMEKKEHPIPNKAV